MVPGHQRIRFTCLKSQTMAELEKTSTDKASRGLEDLRAFKNNFKLEVLESSATSNKKLSSEGSIPQKSSTELNQEKKDLKKFYNSFNLQLSPSQSKPPAEISPTAVNGTSNSLVEPQERLNTTRKKRRPPKSAEFSDLYDKTDDELGKGAHSRVLTCFHKATKMEFAVKVVPKASSHQREKVLKEVEILYMCKESRFVLRLVELFEDPTCFHLVFDKMYGGPLLAHIQRRKCFTEREASEVVREVAEALNFLHKRGVAHRDLKPENILCEKEDQVVPVRICDFDLSSTIVPTSSTQNTPISTPMLHTPVGSAEFMAPEVVGTFLGDGFSYDKKCDLWSLGVTLYLMLCGEPPFKGGCGQKCGWEDGESCHECQDILLSRIQKCEYSFPEEYWKDISEEAKNLVRDLLQVDSKLRPTAEEVLRHPWLEQAAPDTPLHTPVVLKRFPGSAAHLSNIVASCLACERQRAPQSTSRESHTHRPSINQSHSPNRSFNLSPPGSSELAHRREYNHTSS